MASNCNPPAASRRRLSGPMFPGLPPPMSPLTVPQLSSSGWRRHRSSREGPPDWAAPSKPIRRRGTINRPRRRPRNRSSSDVGGMIFASGNRKQRPDYDYEDDDEDDLKSKPHHIDYWFPLLPPFRNRCGGA